MTDPQNDQLRQRHQLPEALDQLRDSVTEGGPDPSETDRVLGVVVARHPQFAARLIRLVGMRAQDDTGAVAEGTPMASLVQGLVGQDDEMDAVVDTLQEENANVMAEALIKLGTASRLAGLTEWERPGV